MGRNDNAQLLGPTLSKLQKLKDECKEIQEKIRLFKGADADKEYKYLDEICTRHMLALDEIDSGGSENIRKMRKDVILLIEACVNILEERANGKTGSIYFNC